MLKKLVRGFFSFYVVLLILSFFATGASAAQTNDKTLVVGGDLFGLRLETKGLFVTGIDSIKTENGSASPGKDAGLQKGDAILKINGIALKDTATFSKILARGKGQEVVLLVQRGQEEITLTLCPCQDEDGVYKAGIWVRDGAAGIGTVTFFDPETGTMAGLGHGVCEQETGLLYPLEEGVITYAKIESITKGNQGKPGEISGVLKKEEAGTLLDNRMTGVYARCEEGAFSGKSVPIAKKDQVKKGCATIVCTLDQGGKKEYEIEIEEIVDKTRDCKNFIVHVTDPALLEQTGGIVQGMSGSPILQDGRLMGAVTHVLVDDPTRGYGIFIENMLTAVK